MSLLEGIASPQDLRPLTPAQLTLLADEIRAFLIKHVSRTGGHLGPNLGVVELTIALHRVFDSPRDPIIFDTGHQSYVHKMLTGRQRGFPTLRQKGGLSGYPARQESSHDWVENSHASTSLSWGEGLAQSFRMRGDDRTVVSVIGDGALTGGMAWEALNNISVERDLRLIVVVNDNGRSYTPTVGGVASHLSSLRTDRRYEETLRAIKQRVRSAPVVGGPLYDMLHGFKVGVKDVLAPQGLFSDLGFKYLGPIDGHDLTVLERAFDQAKNFAGPVIVHCLTQKGKGYRAAEENEEDRFHAIGRIDEETGEPLAAESTRTFTSAFGAELLRLGQENTSLVAITAAMLHPTGLAPFATAFPDRILDVGIAEQHAITLAAGLAAGGMHPVVALYATFLNRAFDQVLMDVALHKQGVTIVLDRAGVTGTDGASHNGMWDLSLMGIVPGLQLAAPRDETRLLEALRRAVTVSDASTVIRYSKEALPEPIEAVARHGGVDILAAPVGARLLIIGYGAFVELAVAVGDRLAQQGIQAAVADPVWALPVSEDLVDLCRSHDLVITLEDGGLAGGLGTQLGLALSERDIRSHVHPIGVPQRFLEHGSRAEVLAEVGLTAQNIARTVLGLALAHERETNGHTQNSVPANR